MKTEDELKAIRYLLNDLILYVYDLRIKLDELVPTKRKYKMGEPNGSGNSIHFDLFTIPKNEYIPYRTPFNSLGRKFIKEVMFENIKEKKNGS